VEQSGGDLKGARRRHEEAVELSREVGNRFLEGKSLNLLTWVLNEQGDFETARRRSEQEMAVKREPENSEDLAWAQINLAQLAMATGYLAEAQRNYRLALTRHLDAKYLAGVVYQDLARFHLLRGELDLAWDSSVAARRLQENFGTQPAVIFYATLTTQAEILLARDEPEKAAAEANRALSEFRTRGLVDSEAIATILVARALIAQELDSEAQEHLARVRAAAMASERPVVRLGFALAAARLAVMGGELVEAKALLTAAQEEAQALGLVALDLEASMALGAVERDSGLTLEGGIRMARATERAKDLGYVLGAVVSLGRAR
jgi:tetratricopeptide (TPR) repeat protein